MKKTMRIGSMILWVIVWLISIVAIAGIYKFNILQDDIFYAGEWITHEDQELFIGSRTQPIPGNKKAKQWFILKEDRTAESINMETLLYQNWDIVNWRLILTAESIWNWIAFVSDEEYVIESVWKNKLYLKIWDIMSIFSKE